jgi:hypothetical protein
MGESQRLFKELLDALEGERPRPALVCHEGGRQDG